MLGLAVTTAIVVGDLMTTLVTALIALATVNGYVLGASRIVAVLGGLLAATLVAIPAGRQMEGSIGAIIGTTGLTNRLLSVCVMTVIVLAVVACGLHVVIRRYLRQHPRLQAHDRLLGALLGLLEGGIMSLIVIWTVLSIEPIAAAGVHRSPAHAAAANPVAERVLVASQALRSSVVGRAADGVNPLRDLRFFILFQKALIVLNDPIAHEAFVNHGAIIDLKARPSVREAIRILQEDDTMLALMEGRRGITADDLRAMLDSPVILRIFDETSIIRDLKPMAAEIERAIAEATRMADADGSEAGPAADEAE